MPYVVLGKRPLTPIPEMKPQDQKTSAERDRSSVSTIMKRSTAREGPLVAVAPALVAAPVVLTLKRIGKAIRDMELPAVEKIAEETSGTPFHVLVRRCCRRRRAMP